MADDAKESKAKKLAAARKKLKEYQSRNMESAGGLTTSSMTTSTTSVASSERSETEISVEENTPNTEAALAEMPAFEQANLANYFNATAAKEQAFELNLSAQQQQLTQQQQQQQTTANSFEQFITPANSNGNANHFETTTTTPTSFQLNEQFQQQQQQHLNAMQLLVAEKTQLTAELERWRNFCREKDYNLEDLRTQLHTRNQEFEDFQHNFKQQQQSTEQLRKQNAELMHKLSQANAAHEDQSAHLHELQQQLKLAQAQIHDLEKKFNEKSTECELAQLRVKQLSDENKDERVVEAATTQNQFMYEQQIRDLQAMVQQFTQDKEQSSIQYQNYVQHLNAEVAKLNERNSDLNDTCTQLQERERQLVEHISELEREIQKNLSLRQTAEENQTAKTESQAPPTAELEALRQKITTLEERSSDFDFERHEFLLKIKSQEDRLEKLQAELSLKEATLESISRQLPEQSEQVKLLATMESDKIAASRALDQNIKLKAQLDEMEMRFVQLTNDKAELTIQLDKEIFEKRAIVAKMEDMETNLKSLEEKFQNKDEEMIRLSHENMELKQEILVLQQQNDRLKHYEVQNYSSNYTKTDEAVEEHMVNEVHEAHESHDEHHHHHHHHHHDHGQHHDHQHDNDVHTHAHNHEQAHHEHTSAACNHEAETEACQEAHEHEAMQSENEKIIHKIASKTSATPHIATAEAVEKLQTRFTYLMSQVANLTDEKEKLEHLVLQLQDETETIGEYIALYQTQRRILKQREYEKAAQTRLLQEEREKLREKVAQLNELVSKLGLLEKTTTLANVINSNSNEADIKTQLQAALAESVSIEPQQDELNEQQQQRQQQQLQTVGDVSLMNQQQQHAVSQLPAAAANELLMQIQNIVTEIKENTTRDLPLLDAKTNNAIEICHCCEGQLKVV